MLGDLQEKKGVIAIATTPFDEKNYIDYESVESLADYSDRDKELIETDIENELI